MENIEFEAENGHKIKFEKTDGEIYTLGIKLDTFHDYVLEKHETIALRDFLNSLDLEKKKDFVWVCNECNFENLTSSVSERDIIKRNLSCVNCGCDEFHKVEKDCKDGQHSGDTGKCSECGRTYIHGAK